LPGLDPGFPGHPMRARRPRSQGLAGPRPRLPGAPNAGETPALPGACRASTPASRGTQCGREARAPRGLPGLDPGFPGHPMRARRPRSQGLAGPRPGLPGAPNAGETPALPGACRASTPASRGTQCGREARTPKGLTGLDPGLPGHAMRARRPRSQGHRTFLRRRGGADGPRVSGEPRPSAPAPGSRHRGPSRPPPRRT
jgi:hypothetical protein